MKNYWKRGEPMVLAAGATLALILFMTLTLLAVILGNSLGYFWVKDLVRFQLRDGSFIMGQQTATGEHALTGVKRVQLKVGNRDLYSQDFRWVDQSEIAEKDLPADAFLLERREHGNFFGFLKELRGTDGGAVSADTATLRRLHQQLGRHNKGLKEIRDRMSDLNQASERLRLKILKLEYKGAEANSALISSLNDKKEKLTEEFDGLNDQLNLKQAELNKAVAVFADASGTVKEIPLLEIVQIYQPNSMSAFAKAGEIGRAHV